MFGSAASIAFKPPAFGTDAQIVRDAKPAGGPKPLTAKAKARQMRAASEAAGLIPQLPKPGESIHCLMTGPYNLCNVITATLHRCEVRTLRIATLCYSKSNAKELLAILEDRQQRGQPLAFTLLVSKFFVEHNKEMHEWFREQLNAFPNCRIASARSHCKVVCMDLGKRDAFVFEGSANLRNNRNWEQLTVIRSRPVHDWHAAWIDELVNNDGQTYP